MEQKCLCYCAHNCNYFESGGYWIYQAEENSLPVAAQASDLELNEKRAIDSYMLGVPYEVISEYSIVDDEYVKTRELNYEYHVATNTSTLSYYEMGVLVKEHDLTDMSADEFEALYPDLNFWIKG